MNTQKLWIPLTLSILVLAAVLSAAMPSASLARAEHEAQLESSTVVPIIHEIKPYTFDLLAVDIATGEIREDLTPIPIGREFIYTLSDDGRWAALAIKPVNSAVEGEALVIVDIVNWQATRIEYDFNYQAARLLLDPARKRLVLIEQLGAAVTWNTGYRYTYYDWVNQEVLASAESLLGIYPTYVTLLEGGAKLAVHGEQFVDKDNQGVSSFALVDLETMIVQWRGQLPDVKSGVFGLEGDHWEDAEYFSPGSAFDAEHGLLYVAHPESETVTTVDFNQRALSTVELQPAASNWLEALLLADARTAHAKVANGTHKQALVVGNGAYLVITGSTTRWADDDEENWEVEIDMHDMLVVNTQTMQVVHRLDIEGDYMALGVRPDEVIVYHYRDDHQYSTVINVQSGEINAEELLGAMIALPLPNAAKALVGYHYDHGTHRLLIYNDIYREIGHLDFDGYSYWIAP